HRGEGLDRADGLDLDRDVLLGHNRHHHRHRGRLAGGGPPDAGGGAGKRRGQEKRQRDALSHVRISWSGAMGAALSKRSMLVITWRSRRRKRSWSAGDIPCTTASLTSRASG